MFCFYTYELWLEKNFRYFAKIFGRIKRVVTFAAPKEGNRLQFMKEEEEIGTVVEKKVDGQHLRNYEGADFL